LKLFLSASLRDRQSSLRALVMAAAETAAPGPPCARRCFTSSRCFLQKAKYAETRLEAEEDDAEEDAEEEAAADAMEARRSSGFLAGTGNLARFLEAIFEEDEEEEEEEEDEDT
jgi:hypothetical protein